VVVPVQGVASVLFLAAVSVDDAIKQFIEFLSRIMMVIGIAVVFYGGWKIHRGEVEEGVLALIGGFIVCLAVPIIKVLASYAGIST
jgi:hypothetical protein